MKVSLLTALEAIMTQPNPDHSEGRANAQIHAATMLIKHGDTAQVDAAIAVLSDGALGNRGFGNAQRVAAIALLLDLDCDAQQNTRRHASGSTKDKDQP